MANSNRFSGYSTQNALTGMDLRDASGYGTINQDYNYDDFQARMDDRYSFDMGRARRLSGAEAMALCEAQERGISYEDALDGMY